MAVNRSRINIDYGLTNPLQQVPPQPIVANRAPTTSDTAEIGTLWIDKLTNASYVLTSIAAGLATWTTSAFSANPTVTTLTVTGGVGTVLDVQSGDVSVDAGNLTVTGNLTITGTTTLTGPFILNDTGAIALTSTDNAPGAIALLVNGGAAETLTIISDQGTGNGAIALTAVAGGITLSGGKATANAINLTASNAAGGLTSTVGTGGYSFTATNGNSVFNTGTGSLSLSSDAAATTVNIGTGAAVVKTISIGGTGANVIAIGNTQTAGSVTIGNAMTTGTIQVGSTAAQTGNFDLAPGIGVQAITLGNASGGAKTISIGNGTLGNQISIGNGVNSVSQTVNISGGASAANSIVNILSGNGSAGTQTLNALTGTRAGVVHIADGAAANLVTIGATTGAAALTLQAGSGNMLLDTSAQNGTISATSGTGTISISADAAATTVNIGTGAAVVKTISVGGTGANVIAIGNTQTAGSIAMGTAMTTGIVSIGGTGAMTGNFDLAPGTGAQTVTLGNGGTAAKTINIGNGIVGNTISVGNGANSSAQIINVAAGASAANSTVNILSGNGSAGTQTANILTGTRAGAVNIGSGAAAHQIVIGNSNAGNLTTLASPITALPGPVYIYTGAGAPGNGLALHVGDLYINTTAASATTRMYIATAASTWTNVTCAA